MKSVRATESRVNALRRQSRTRKEPVMKNAITYVGLDGHKKDIYVAMLVGHSISI